MVSKISPIHEEAQSSSDEEPFFEDDPPEELFPELRLPLLSVPFLKSFNAENRGRGLLTLIRMRIATILKKVLYRNCNIVIPFYLQQSTFQEPG
jgi:hypothetical protein